MNNHRAAHTVNDCGMGYNVRLTYRGYIISLAADGEDTQVWDRREKYLWSCFGTQGESIQQAMEFINAKISEEKGN
jgi:hypothetical protein